MTMDRLGVWLIAYLIHSTALLSAAWWITKRRRLNPAIREVIWKAALFGSVATSAIHAVGMPPITGKVTLFRPVKVAKIAIPAPEVDTGFAPISRAVPVAPANEQHPDSGTVALGPGVTTDAGDAAARRTKSIEPGRWSARLKRAGALGMSAWLVAAPLLMGWFLVRRWQLARRLRGRRPLEDHPALVELEELQGESGFAGKVRLTVSNRLASPIAVGLGEICVPAQALSELDPEQRRGMLAHELAHLVRRDPVWLTLAALVERALFVQPLNRLARRRLQVEAELLCDGWAADRMGSGLPVAKCLVKFAEWIDSGPGSIPVAGMAEEQSQLIDRVRHLVEEDHVFVKPRSPVMAGLVVSLLGMTTMLMPQVTVADQNSGAGAGAEAGQHEHASTGSIGSARQGSQDTTGVVVAALIEALRDSSAEVRATAAASLGNLGDRRATEALMAVLDDPDYQVRLAGLSALGQLGDPAAIPAIVSRLQDDSTEMRHTALRTLFQFNEGVPPDVFRVALQDPSAEIRGMAIEKLGQLGDVESAPAIAAMAGDSVPDIRVAVLRTLAALGADEALPLITQSFGDPDVSVRLGALHVLSSIATAPAGSETPSGRLAARVQEGMAEGLPGEVIALASDSSEQVRSAVLWLVGVRQDARGVDVARQLLEDPIEGVRLAAVEALATIRNDAAIEGLLQALRSGDPAVRKAAAAALGRR